MSKKLTVVCRDQDLVVEDFNGTFYVHRTSTAKDFRGQAVRADQETILTLAPDEMSLLASAIRDVLGYDVKTAQPKERIVTPPTETASSDDSGNNGI